MNQIEIPSSFRSLIGMGEAVAIYESSLSLKLLGIFCCLVVLPGGFYVLYYGVAVYPSLHPETPITAFLFISLLLLAFGLYGIWLMIAKWGQMAILYKNGFAYSNGSEVFSFTWNNIAYITAWVVVMRVQGAIPVGTSRLYTIANQSALVKLDGSLNKVDQLANEIRKNAFPYLISKYKQEFDADKTLQFGSIFINKSEGVRKGNRKYKWIDMLGIRVANGGIEFVPKKHASLASFSARFSNSISDTVKNIPNIDVLLAMSNAMIQQNNQR